MILRQPIIATLGSVDDGKTTLLDRIRSTAVAKKEPGQITQSISASEVPSNVIEKVSGPILKALKAELKIPGLLFIDTPGHEAFTNLRRRGGSVADFAILVVSLLEGVKPMTSEAISILKEYKTPFLVAANKIDLITGWKPQDTASFQISYKNQLEHVQARLDEKLYELVGRLGQMGFSSERYDRVDDFTKNIAIIPVSAKTGEGISELLAFLSGLTQRYMEQQLRTEVKGPGRGSILEVKEERGLGKTIDVILYDGSLKKNDTIVFGTLKGGTSTKIRGLFKPSPPDVLRKTGERFMSIDEVHAACGVKIFAPGLENALAGSELMVAQTQEEVKEFEDKLKQEIGDILIETSGEGIILKADTLGSVEGLTKLLQGADVPIRKASIGHVTKKDVMDAYNAGQLRPYHGIILSFNAPVLEEAAKEAARYHIPILQDNVIYTLLENYRKWVDAQREAERGEAYTNMVLPGKIKLLTGYAFRISKPIIVGVEVMQGRIKSGYRLINAKGQEVGDIKQIQRDKEAVDEAKQGDQLALSIDSQFTLGRQVKEGDILYTDVPKSHAGLLTTKYKEFLTADELKLLLEIRKVKGEIIFGE